MTAKYLLPFILGVLSEVIAIIAIACIFVSSDALAGLGEWALNTIKSIFGIQSPSKVWKGE